MPMKAIIDYRPPPQVMSYIHSARAPRPLFGMFLVCFDHILIWVPTLVAMHTLPMCGVIAVAPVAWLLSTRSMRGLECIVHEGSHYNFIMRGPIWKKRLSDLLCNIFAAIPVFSTVQRYRKSHDKHHLDLGYESDPDKVRHEALNLETLDRESAYGFAIGIAIRLGNYVPSWWHAIGTTPFVAFIGLNWHLLIVALLAYTQQNVLFAITAWLYCFGVPFAFFLPILRLVGESEEHNYHGDFGISLRTYTNVGFIQSLIIHPHCDGYHTLHHLFPHVPHSRLPELDKILRVDDPTGWSLHLLERRHILEKLYGQT